MFSILATLKSEVIRSIIKNARKNRAVQNENNEEELVYITKSMYEEINGVLTQNCKNRMLIIKIVKIGNAWYLLKRSSKFNKNIKKNQKNMSWTMQILMKMKKEKKKINS